MVFLGMVLVKKSLIKNCREVAPETLKYFANWQWPEIQFNLKMYSLIIKKKKVLLQLKGNCTGVVVN
jgi:general secretion pathway protein N